jgi:hypothetical protein
MSIKKETIDKIKELAEFLVRDKNADKIKKRIIALDSIKNPDGLRRFILHYVIAENYNSGNKEAILISEDYINYLFPDRSYWSEIRDILLIAIYQEMHEKNLILEELKIDFESEENKEGNNNNVDSKIMNVYLNILNKKNNNDEETADLNVIADLIKQHENLKKTSDLDIKMMNSFLDSLTNLADDEED